MSEYGFIVREYNNIDKLIKLIKHIYNAPKSHYDSKAQW